MKLLLWKKKINIVSDREKVEQIQALISVLTQMVDITNQEINGRCIMYYSSGLILGIPEQANQNRCYRLQSKLEGDYPFIHSWTDKDREGGYVPPDAQKLIDNAMVNVQMVKQLASAMGFSRLPTSFADYQTMVDDIERRKTDRTRQEREAHNQPRRKRLFSSQPCDGDGNQYDKNKS